MFQLVSRGFCSQVGAALFSLLFNILLILVALKIQSIPKMTVFPLILRAFLEIITAGLANLAANIFALFNDNTSSLFNWTGNMKVSSKVVFCTTDFLLLILNEYSIGFCILGVALERFFTICVNSKKSTEALKCCRKCACIFLIVTLFSFIIFSAYSILKSAAHYNCFATTFHGDYLNQIETVGLILFVAPAAVSGCLFALLAFKLCSKNSQLKKKDKIFSLGSITSYGMWLMCWGRKWANEMYTLKNDFHHLLAAGWSFYKVWDMVYIPCQFVYTILNPVVTILFLLYSNNVATRERKNDLERKNHDENKESHEEAREAHGSCSAIAIWKWSE